MTGVPPYPPDDFDVDEADDRPRGVHRAPRSWWRRWGPLIAVLVAFPLMAFALVTWMSEWDGPNPVAAVVGTPEPGATDGTETADTTDPSASTDPEAPADAPTDAVDAEEPAQEPAAEPEPEPEPDLAQEVEVYNATSTSGLAAAAAEQLGATGYTTVTTGNWRGSAVPGSVVYYSSEAQAVTARSVAAALGIDTVELSAERGGAGVVAVLAADYAP